MLAVRLLSPILLAVLLSAPSTAVESGGGAVRFVTDFCVRCHGAETREADIRLDELSDDLTADGSRWAVVLDQVRRGKMPPKDEKPQPTNDQRRDFIKAVSGQLGAHAQKSPNLGNLVPHELLFGSANNAAKLAKAPAPRLWRLSP